MPIRKLCTPNEFLWKNEIIKWYLQDIYIYSTSNTCFQHVCVSGHFDALYYPLFLGRISFASSASYSVLYHTSQFQRYSITLIDFLLNKLSYGYCATLFTATLESINCIVKICVETVPCALCISMLFHLPGNFKIYRVARHAGFVIQLVWSKHLHERQACASKKPGVEQHAFIYT